MVAFKELVDHSPDVLIDAIYQTYNDGCEETQAVRDVIVSRVVRDFDELKNHNGFLRAMDDYAQLGKDVALALHANQ